MNTSVNSYALLDSSDIQYAQLKLLQTSSKEVLEQKLSAGNFLNTLSGEIFTKLQVVIVGVKKEFRVWKKDDGLSKHPEYMSNDMRTLIHFDPETGEKIGEEPLAESEVWLNRKSNKKAKTQYFFFAIDTADNSPVFFRVGGLGYKRARKFLNQARSSGKQLFEFVTEISAELEPSQFGSKYVVNLQKSSEPLPAKWSLEKGALQCRQFIQNSQPAPDFPQLPDTRKTEKKM